MISRFDQLHILRELFTFFIAKIAVLILVQINLIKINFSFSHEIFMVSCILTLSSLRQNVTSVSTPI